MANTLPKFVSKICYAASAWIVGGGAREENPRDWDVAVPFAHWKVAAMLMPPDAKPNSFGGWRVVVDDKKIDVWPCDLADLLTNAKMADLWHPQSGARYTRVI